MTELFKNKATEEFGIFSKYLEDQNWSSGIQTWKSGTSRIKLCWYLNSNFIILI